MQTLPFTPQFDAEVQRLTDYIERERTFDEQARNAAVRLKSQYGEIRYGVFAVWAKNWVSETARREINSLSSYAEKISSGQVKCRGRLSDQAVQERIAALEKLWTSVEGGREAFEKLLESLGPTQRLVKFVRVSDDIWQEMKEEKRLLNLIDTCSPKALKAAAKEMQEEFVSFKDGCLAGNQSLKSRRSEKTS